MMFPLGPLLRPEGGRRAGGADAPDDWGTMVNARQSVRRGMGVPAHAILLMVMVMILALGASGSAAAQAMTPDPGQFTVRTDAPICESLTYQVTVTAPNEVGADVGMALQVQGPQSWTIADSRFAGQDVGGFTSWTLRGWVNVGQTLTYRVVARHGDSTEAIVVHGPETVTAPSEQECADGGEPIAVPEPGDFFVGAVGPTCTSAGVSLTVIPLRRLTLTTLELQTHTGTEWVRYAAQPVVPPSTAFDLPVSEQVEYRLVAYPTGDPASLSVVHGPMSVQTPSPQECGTQPEPADPDLSRIFGDNRFLTAIAISQDTFPTPTEDFGGIVFLANGLNFPDALAAGPAVAAQGGSLLLVAPTTGLSQATEDEIRRLAPDEIVLLGKTDNVSAQAEADARALAPTVTRIAGGNRFDTSAQLSDLVVGVDDNDDLFITDTVIVTSGMTFADALAGGTAGGWELAPLLLTHPSGLHRTVEQVLLDRSPSTVRVLGSTATVGAEVETRLRELLPDARIIRYDGRNRYETAAMLNADVFAGPGVEVTLTNGLRFPDALAGAMRVNVTGGPMVPVVTACVPPASFDSIVDLEPVAIAALGKTDAVSDAALAGAVCPG